MVTLLLLALVARIGAALAVGRIPFPDEGYLCGCREAAVQGGGFDTYYRHLPAYPVFLAHLSLGVEVDLRTLRIAQAAVAASGSALVFALGDRIYGRPAAIIAGLVYSLDPLLVVSAGLFYPETPGTLLVPILVPLACLDDFHAGRTATRGAWPTSA
ncbi:MAG: glycosyltransferase family 39 protein [Gemmatimonadales bacterium]|nr:glycosyltransferase family 39 protein [Gemmatimonadales bacterium]